MTFFKIILPLVIGIGFVGCYSTEKPASTHLHFSEQNTETTQQTSNQLYAWTGKYQAVIPCNNCDATLVELTLNDDLSYSLSKNHINNDGYYPVASVGLFTINPDTPHTLHLDGAADYQTIELHNHGVTLHATTIDEHSKDIRLIKTS